MASDQPLMPAVPLRAVFVGSDTLLLQCVETFAGKGHHVVAVATDSDKVRRFCAEHALRCIDAAADLPAQLAGERFDHLFAITWLHLLPDAVLRLPQRFGINFHDGPLPRYAGLNATCHALLAGEPEHGITWHRLDGGTDTGPILLQRRFPVAADDTAFTLNARCFAAGLESFGELIDGLAAGTLAAVPQDLGQRTCFGRSARPPALGVIDWQQPAAAIDRLVRALDHGGYRNPFGIAKVVAPRGAFAPAAVAIVPGRRAAPGTVLAVDVDAVQVAAIDGEIRLLRPRSLANEPLGRDELQALGVVVGAQLPLLSGADAAALVELDQRARKGEAAFVELLATAAPLPVPGGGAPDPGRRADVATVAVVLPSTVGPDPMLATAALCAAFLARSSATDRFDVGVRWPQEPRSSWQASLVVEFAPVRLRFDFAASGAVALATARAVLAAQRDQAPLLRELVVRHPERLQPGTRLEPPVRLSLGTDAAETAPGTLVFAIAPDGSLRLFADAAVLPPERLEALAARLSVFAAGLDQAASLAAAPLLSPQELHRLLHEWNDTASPPPAEPLVHRQFALQAVRTPERTAVSCGDASVDYWTLHTDAERLAAWLLHCGVGVGDRVGICTRRGIGMVTAVLAVLRAGAAYVPLDPDYPRDRLQFMAEDAGLAALVVDATTRGRAPVVAAPRIDLAADRAAIDAHRGVVDAAPAGDSLAYLIYTSGSTGRPKGVMVRHRNVTNFFLGMDRVLQPPGDAFPGTWLAVTSLSFDISVLELLWTLARGFTVVLHQGEPHTGPVAPPAAPAAARDIAFSLFYFASDAGEHEHDRYRLLLDGARFADQHGFEAVWTPERHFHAFGGLYPNPAVASAAIASITQNVQIRAGSCVLPLHHPIRVAEEWALVDNLSRGRVGIAFAAGWHANDFVLMPQNFADRKQVMFLGIRQVQALWRGEAVAFPGRDGTSQQVRTLPRPVQRELPTWITVAGNPETYRQAGEHGAFVLTHLLGQSLDELAGKLAAYRAAWRAAGHPGEGKVTLMLHTFVGDDEQRVREIVREPLKGYLRSSVDLVRQAAWSFPAFKQKVEQRPGDLDELLNGGLSADDLEALLDFAFERYYQHSGLFGTPDSCVATVDRLRALGVDEVACLIDFGVPTDTVLRHLPHLLALKQRCDVAHAAATAVVAANCPLAAPAPASPSASIPDLLVRHAVTHLQCTPSLASMLLLDPAARPALRSVRHLLVGGEALPAALARELRACGPSLHDVYGPTETTVWSTTCVVGDDDPVPIGRPLANQRVYVLDGLRQLVPIGATGELWIGGAGVTAGYFRRPELTAERFVADPFVGGGASMYRTGDLVRWRDDGKLEYIGRGDQQVKIRGHRLELGEIEAALLQHRDVREAAVVARADAGELRLVAYVVGRQGAPDAEALRAHLRSLLPEVMVPGSFVALAALPRTPNQKIDRRALPAPAAVGSRPTAPPQDATEDAILAIWRRALGTEAVGVEDNFFDSGGHSLLAVRVHREIQHALAVELAVTDLFRFTTVRALARHLQAGSSAPTAAQQATERALKRRNLLRRGS